jgi:hypothetical protein
VRFVNQPDNTPGLTVWTLSRRHGKLLERQTRLESRVFCSPIFKELSVTTRVHFLIFGTLFAGALAVWASVGSARQEATTDSAKAGSAVGNPISVSLIQLIATPDAFDGKLVRVYGFVRIEHEGTAVYLHRDDCEFMLTRNGLWLAANDVAPEGSKESLVNNHYALIEGQFDAKNKGHLALWSGSIDKITRMEPWNIRKGAK